MRPTTPVLLAALALGAPQAASIVPQSRAGQELREVVPVVMDDAYQLVFFAVLEGLYRDGVSSEVAVALIAPPPDDGYPVLFVWQCPLCMPALNAFKVYGARPPFLGIKAPRDTFGAGLAPELAARCLGSDLVERGNALNELVERWIGERLDSMRLTDDERVAWQTRLELLRERGMDTLSGLQRAGSYAGIERCAVCDGANDALRRP